MRPYFSCLKVLTLLVFPLFSIGMSTTVVHAQTVLVTLMDSSIKPKTIQVNKNEPVHITIVNKGTRVHNFVIPKFYVFSPNIKPNGQVDVRFTPDKTGTFQYYSDKKGIPEKGIHGLLYVHQT